MEIREIKRGTIEGEIRLPGSKSYTNRALLVSALADGESILRNPLRSDDTERMAEALRRLGFELRWEESITVNGLGGEIPVRRAELDAGEAGTVMRLLTSFVCLGRGQYRIDGSARLRKRPVGELVRCLRKLGAEIECECDFPPVRARARGLKGGRVSMPGHISSQFFSSVLIVAPYTEVGVELEVEGELVSAPYVEMTVDVMRRFGVEVEAEDHRRFAVGAPQCYKTRDYAIEPDASSATYFLAGAGITGGRICIRDIDLSSKQADIEFARVLSTMGCKLSSGEGWLHLEGGELEGIEVDMGSMPDSVQTLAVTALFARGTTTIRGVPHLRLKETDRLRDTATELCKLGARVTELDDGLIITPGPLKPADIDPHNDHRMAMSFALAGLRIGGVRILTPQCVRKSFPDFFERLEDLTVSSEAL